MGFSVVSDTPDRQNVWKMIRRTLCLKNLRWNLQEEPCGLM